MSSAEEEVQAKKKVSNSNHQKPSFLEVTCKGTRKVRRFAVGTEAGFALSSINRKLDSGIPPASYIEAFKEGEEPVIFGPSSVLVDYGDDWRLQAVPEGDYKESKSVKPTVKQSPAVQSSPEDGIEEAGKLQPHGIENHWSVEKARVVMEVMGITFPEGVDADKVILDFLNVRQQETRRNNKEEQTPKGQIYTGRREFGSRRRKF